MTARRLHPPGTARPITIRHDGESYPAHDGEPLAAALLAAGVSILGRSVKYHRPRGAPCGSGDCAHCLVRVDGMPNRAACLTPCHDGLESESQNVIGSAEHDLLGVTDWMFPWGLDHHEMFTGVPLVQPVVQKIVRKLSGLGRLPADEAAPTRREAHPRDQAHTQAGRSLPVDAPLPVDVLVVGAGCSGLAAAAAARAAGADVLVVEARDLAGGRLVTGLHGDPSEAATTTEAVTAAGATLWTDSAAVQVDREAAPLEVLVLRPDRLCRIRPAQMVLACGGYGATGLFENNDLPGVVAADWAARLITRWGVLPGEAPLVCADAPEAAAISALFEAAGATPVRTIPLSAAFAPAWPEPPTLRLTAVKGGRSVEKAVLETEDGKETVRCDLVVVASPPAPAFELALSAGAQVAFEPESGGFAVVTDATGRTAAGDVLACGTLTGPCSPTEARRRGLAAGESAATTALRERASRRSLEGDDAP